MNNELERDLIAELQQLFSHFDWQLFHFERPLLLIGIALSALLVALLWTQKKRASDWCKHIDSELLEHLLDGQLVRAQKRVFIGLFFAWVLACIAMAGPSWHKLPQPVHKKESAQVVIFDLSPSMVAADLKPSRLTRARLKLIDLLNARSEGLHALIVYAGEAHVVTPLTDDTETIINQLPALSPNIMPMAGSNIEMAISQALTLFTESGLNRGDILLVTDGIEPHAATDIRKQLRNTEYRLSILGVGSDEGAPIATGRGGFARDSMGAIVIAKLESGKLRELASDLGGRFSILRNDDRDITTLNNLPPLADQQTRKIEREFDVWQDAGQWLVLLLLPFALFAFRRGMILPALLCIPFIPQPASAFEWQDLWQTADQQGHQLFKQGKAAQAAETFDNNQWQGSAHYNSGNYEAAIEAFANSSDPTAHYNRGNALARTGKLDDALAAYNKALEQQPDFEDALSNKALIEQLKNQQQEQEQSDSSDEQSEQNSEEGTSENSESNSENGDKDGSEEKSGDESQGKPEQNSKEGSQEGSNSEQSGGDPSGDGEPQQQEKSSTDNSQPDNSSEPEEKGTSQQPDFSEESAPKDTSASTDEDSPEGDSENNPKDNSKDNKTNPPEQEPSAAEHSDDASEASTQTQQTAAQLAEEEQQAEQIQQWLRGIPDDPSGLLREKFKYQHQQQLRESMRGRSNKPDNGAADRW